MRVAAFLSLLAFTWAQCDTPTCILCQQMSGCTWFTAGGVGSCQSNTSVAVSLGATATAMGQCPQCQAGTCVSCQNQTGCTWYQNSIGALGGTCATNSTPPTPVGSYSAVAMCPACSQSTDCNSCTSMENQTNYTCGWYRLPGSSGGKCAEAAPSVFYSKVTNFFCSGNPCAGLSCSACLNTSGSCAFYSPLSGLSALYNAKCDINASGVVTSTLYTQTTTCPPCASGSCSTCQTDPTAGGCQWVGVAVLSTVSFGQCVKTGMSVTGKTVITTCPNVCQIYSCSACVANTLCRWYTGSSVLSDGCDLPSNSLEHPGQNGLSALPCPTCKDSRCYECNSESGCNWYALTAFGDIVPFSDKCYSTGGAPSSLSLIASTSSKCKGSPAASSAVAVVPGLFVFLGYLLM